MADQADARVKVTADASQATAVLQQFSQRVSELSRGMLGSMLQMTDGMHGGMSKMQSAVTTLQNRFIALGALVGGGALFKGAVDDLVNESAEVAKLSKVLGVTGEEASRLNVALKLTGQSAAEFSDIAFKLLRNINSNEEGMRKLGFETRDADGNLRPLLEQVRSAANFLMTFREGVDRDAAAMYLFGKGAQEAMGILKLNNEVMQRAKSLADEYGIGIGDQTREQVRKFKIEQAAMNVIWGESRQRLAEQLLPTLTKLAGWFSTVGPDALRAMETALKAVISAVDWLGTKFGRLMVEAALAADNAASIWRTVADIINMGGTATVQQIADRWQKGYEERVRNQRAAQGAIEDHERESAARIAKLWGEAAAKAAPGRFLDDKDTSQVGGRRFRNPEEGSDAVSRFQTELAALKVSIQERALEEGKHREMSKAEEAAFWRTKRDLFSEGSREYLALSKNVSEAELADMKDKHEATVAGLNAELAQYRYNFGEKLRLANEIADKYDAGSKQYEDAQKRIADITRAAAEQEKKVQDVRAAAHEKYLLDAVAMERDAASAQRDLGLITQTDYLQRETAFEERLYVIKAEALRTRLALESSPENRDKNPEAIAQLNAQIEQLEREHQQRLRQITQQMRVERSRDWQGMFSSMESGFAGVLKNLMSGMTSFGQAIRATFQVIFDAVVGTLAQIAARWLIEQVMQRVIGKVTALSQVGANAAVAASAAYASTAMIPFIGPALAPEAAAAAYAGALSWAAAIPAAAKGFDVPAGVNPVTQLHAKEMVLPERYADVIRTMAEGGAQGPQGGQVVMKIYAMDGRDVYRTLKRNQGQVARFFKGAQRDFEL